MASLTGNLTHDKAEVGMIVETDGEILVIDEKADNRAICTLLRNGRRIKVPYEHLTDTGRRIK